MLAQEPGPAVMRFGGRKPDRRNTHTREMPGARAGESFSECDVRCGLEACSLYESDTAMGSQDVVSGQGVATGVAVSSL